MSAQRGIQLFGSGELQIIQNNGVFAGPKKCEPLIKSTSVELLFLKLINISTVSRAVRGFLRNMNSRLLFKDDDALWAEGRANRRGHLTMSAWSERGLLFKDDSALWAEGRANRRGHLTME